MCSPARIGISFGTQAAQFHAILMLVVLCCIPQHVLISTLLEQHSNSSQKVPVLLIFKSTIGFLLIKVCEGCWQACTQANPLLE